MRIDILTAIPEVVEDDKIEIRNGYKVYKNQLLHRSIYAQFHKIPSGYVIHHIDCNKLNNHIDNLIALPRILHDILHQKMYERKEIFNRNQINCYLDSYEKDMETLRLINKKWKLSDNRYKALKNRRKKNRR